MTRRHDFKGSNYRGKYSSEDKFFLTAFCISAAVIIFLLGSIITSAGIPPGPQITKAYQGGKAVYSKLFHYDDVFTSDLWHSTKNQHLGVSLHNPQLSNQGLTLYTSGHEPSAYLISMSGDVIHKWHRPFSKVWNKTATVKNPQPDSHVYMRKASLNNNGDLLVIYEGVGDSPYGYGLAKLDKDSNVKWSYLQSVHHDFDVAADGKIYALTQEAVDEPLPRLDHLSPTRLEDFLVVLSPTGEELKKIRLLDAVDKSDFRQLLFSVSSFSIADPLHTNSVHLITTEDAKSFPFGKAGQLLLSFREPSALAVLDLEKETLTWSLKGYWSGQHDPHILPNGNILLFDNRGNFQRQEGQSRAIEFNPRNLQIVWQYTGTKEDPLESVIRSYTQRLPNGNTLITESNGGRILEVTADNQLVWEFVNPIRDGPNKKKIPIICKAQRLPKSAADFLKGSSLAHN